MVRAVLSLVGILATVWVIAMCFGYTTPQVTSLIPSLNRSALHAADLMRGSVSENGRGPAEDGADSAPGRPHAAPGTPAQSPPSPTGLPEQPGAAAPHSDEAEIISPDSTAHLNSAHIHEIEQPTPAWAAASGDNAQGFNPNPQAFVAPNPLPAHPHWIWDVGNREFTDVVVTRVDADLVTIASDTGAAQIDIALLPGEIRQELHYDPVLAAEAAAARKSQATAATTGGP